MVVRLLVVWIALLLVAAPVDTVRAEACPDATVELAVCDDALVVYVIDVMSEHRPLLLATPCRRDAVPQMPALGRIFRPPRASLA